MDNLTRKWKKNENSHQTRPRPTASTMSMWGSVKTDSPGRELTIIPVSSLFLLLTAEKMDSAPQQGESNPSNAHCHTRLVRKLEICRFQSHKIHSNIQMGWCTFERAARLNPVKAVVSTSYPTRKHLLNEYTLGITSAFSFSKYKQNRPIDEC